MTVGELLEQLRDLPAECPLTVRIDVSTGEHDVERRATGEDLIEVMCHRGNGPGTPPTDACVFVNGEVDAPTPNEDAVVKWLREGFDYLEPGERVDPKDLADIIAKGGHLK